MALIKLPPSSSMRNFFPLKAKNPSCPSAIYSLVTILYFRPLSFLSIGSKSTNFGVEASADSPPSSLSSASRRSQTPNTRFPGPRWESQDTRMPDITGKRLDEMICVMKLGCCLDLIPNLTLLELARWPEMIPAHPILQLRQAQGRLWDLRMVKSQECSPALQPLSRNIR